MLDWLFGRRKKLDRNVDPERGRGGSKSLSETIFALATITRDPKLVREDLLVALRDDVLPSLKKLFLFSDESGEQADAAEIAKSTEPPKPNSYPKLYATVARLLCENSIRLYGAGFSQLSEDLIKIAGKMLELKDAITELETDRGEYFGCSFVSDQVSGEVKDSIVEQYRVIAKLVREFESSFMLAMAEAEPEVQKAGS